MWLWSLLRAAVTAEPEPGENNSNVVSADDDRGRLAGLTLSVSPVLVRPVPAMTGFPPPPLLPPPPDVEARSSAMMRWWYRLNCAARSSSGRTLGCGVWDGTARRLSTRYREVGAFHDDCFDFHRAVFVEVDRELRDEHDDLLGRLPDGGSEVWAGCTQHGEHAAEHDL